MTIYLLESGVNMLESLYCLCPSLFLFCVSFTFLPRVMVHDGTDLCTLTALAVISGE